MERTLRSGACSAQKASGQSPAPQRAEPSAAPTGLPADVLLAVTFGQPVDLVIDKRNDVVGLGLLRSSLVASPSTPASRISASIVVVAPAHWFVDVLIAVMSSATTGHENVPAR